MGAREEFDLALKELRAAEYYPSPPDRVEKARVRFGKAQAALEAEEAAPAPAPAAPEPANDDSPPPAANDDEKPDARSGKRKGK